jgi:hypothetical protein
LRAAFRDLGGLIGERLTSAREGEAHSISAWLSVIVTLSASAIVVNPSLPVEQQVISVVQQLAEQARTEIPELPPLLTQADLDRFKARQDVFAVQDLSIALLGLAITALGIMFGGFGIILGAATVW